MSGEGRSHILELSKLAEKDPEFYKYLQENDRELLDFNPDRAEDDVDLEVAEDERMPEEKAPLLTKEVLRRWQKALLEVRPPALRLRYIPQARTATVVTSIETSSHRLPCCRTHE